MNIVTANSNRKGPDMRVLIITSVAAEQEAVLRGLRGSSRFEVLAGGVGPAAAAVSTATALAASTYSLVLSVGIAGGFAGRAEIGSLVVADTIIAADLGAETPEGFCSLDELGFGSSRIQLDAELVSSVTDALRAAGLPAAAGPILSVSTVTGTAESAMNLAKRVPGATAEAMEGYGVAVAALQHKIPCMEIRAISNMVGPRDRAAWRIKDALNRLEAASTVILEVLS